MVIKRLCHQASDVTSSWFGTDSISALQESGNWPKSQLSWYLRWYQVNSLRIFAYNTKSLSRPCFPRLVVVAMKSNDPEPKPLKPLHCLFYIVIPTLWALNSDLRSDHHCWFSPNFVQLKLSHLASKVDLPLHVFGDDVIGLPAAARLHEAVGHLRPLVFTPTSHKVLQRVWNLLQTSHYTH